MCDKCSLQKERRVLTSYHSTTTSYLSLELLNELHVNKDDVIFCIVYVIMKKPPKQDLLFSAPRHWEQTDEAGELATVASRPCDQHFDHSTYLHHLTLPISKRRGFMRGYEFQFQLNPNWICFPRKNFKSQLVFPERQGGLADRLWGTTCLYSPI